MKNAQIFLIYVLRVRLYLTTKFWCIHFSNTLHNMNMTWLAMHNFTTYYDAFDNIGVIYKSPLTLLHWCISFCKQNSYISRMYSRYFTEFINMILYLFLQFFWCSKVLKIKMFLPRERIIVRIKNLTKCVYRLYRMIWYIVVGHRCQYYV